MHPRNRGAAARHIPTNAATPLETSPFPRPIHPHERGPTVPSVKKTARREGAMEFNKTEFNAARAQMATWLTASGSFSCAQLGPQSPRHPATTELQGPHIHSGVSRQILNQAEQITPPLLHRPLPNALTQCPVLRVR